MTDQWILHDIGRILDRRQRAILLDPGGQFGFMLPILRQKGYVVLETDPGMQEPWQRVREEMFLRLEAESRHGGTPVVFHVTRPRDTLSFLFDYCSTHGCLDLSKPAEWLRRILHARTGVQVHLENPLLLTAARLGVGKDIGWWKGVLHGIVDLVSLEAELLPFLADPEACLDAKPADVRKLFEDKVFELLGQPHRAIPAKTLAKEVVRSLFDRLLRNDLGEPWKSIYHRWLDSHTHAPLLKTYVSGYSLPNGLDIWKVHPEHCFPEIDLRQLEEITAIFRQPDEVRHRLHSLRARLESTRVEKVVRDWWKDVIKIAEFEHSALASCRSFEQVVRYYTSEFHPVDRAMRNLQARFLEREEIVRPIQERYEVLNHELLHKWYDHAEEYVPGQQGFLPRLLKQAPAGTAVIVGDGVRYEIAARIAAECAAVCQVKEGVMLADMPSETEHNMSALYAGEAEVIPLHKDREKRLLERSGKAIDFLNVEALHRGVRSDFLVLTYKDIDSAGEKLQMGAVKLFEEFERVLTEKIGLLLKMGFREVHLVTDHGFVLTGLLDEADKIDPSAKGAKEVHERFIRTVEEQPGKDWLKFDRPHGEYRYVYVARSPRPFRTKGVYGFSHGGFTPQEIVVPHFVFLPEAAPVEGLAVHILNKEGLGSTTGEWFVIKLGAAKSATDLFSSSRKVQVELYAGNVRLSVSQIETIDAGTERSMEFSFQGKEELTAVVVDAQTQSRIDEVQVKRSSARDLGGLL